MRAGKSLVGHMVLRGSGLLRLKGSSIAGRGMGFFVETLCLETWDCLFKISNAIHDDIGGSVAFAAGL
jgi:hypothetical protein